MARKNSPSPAAQALRAAGLVVSPRAEQLLARFQREIWLDTGLFYPLDAVALEVAEGFSAVLKEVPVPTPRGKKTAVPVYAN